MVPGLVLRLHGKAHFAPPSSRCFCTGKLRGNNMDPGLRMGGFEWRSCYGLRRWRTSVAARRNWPGVQSGFLRILAGSYLCHPPVRIALAPVLLADKPVHRAKRQDRGGQSEQLPGTRRGEVKNQQLANDGQDSNEDNGANLNETVGYFCYNQKRSSEFEGDYDSKDHTKNSLKHRMVGWIEAS